jgi:para-nitrobenzyl esterase
MTPTIREFLGIPYGAPPVGDLRWQPPQRPARWVRPRDATSFGNHCPQIPTPFARASDTEDCLYLNVYTPQHTNLGALHGHPVMVWIHGGSLQLGESDDYDPTSLVELGHVIVVTINYRLGALGFLTHPALSAESSYGGSGNYGLMDQQFALQWVQRNIHHFGGDPNNVTIFGQSAGGLSVHSHLASPTAAGLFQRAIVQSGAYSLTQPSVADAEAQGTAFAGLVGCSSQTAACLRALPVDTIVNNGFANWPSGMVPTVDGNVLTQSVQDAFSSGQFNQVPVMEGSTHDEWRIVVAAGEIVSGMPLTAGDYAQAIASLPTYGASFPPISTILDAYPLDDYQQVPSQQRPSLVVGAVASDALYTCHARTAAELLSQYVPTYQYEFNDPTAPDYLLPPVSFPTGAFHSAENQYLFHWAGILFPPPALNAAQQQLADAMIEYWTNFARHGDPNAPGAPSWPLYGASDQFQSMEQPAPVTRDTFSFDHQCAFWGNP